MTGSPLVPAPVLAFAERGAPWATWVAGLPRVLSELLAEWDLTPSAPTLHGHTAVVVPVGSAVLKVAFPDEESEHEALALQRWGGRGAVRLLRADPHRRALLLERLSVRDLSDAWDVEACEHVAKLYRHLHVPAPPQLRTLTSYVARWDAALGELPGDAPLPRRLVQQARALTRDLIADPDSVGTLVHTDLHYENVLAAERAPWLVIDPKPVSGDPHYEPAPMLWNRWDEVVASGDVRDAVRRRFHTLVDTAGLDEHRARDWVVVRMVHLALGELRGHPVAPDQDWLTRCVAIAKAVQD
ncbi:MAG: aminoglycoside phosphotransferase family protein [Nocardioides sp.]|nr:aminoglycoside phosphotransferase family protein [Nocardioides sp.]